MQKYLLEPGHKLITLFQHYACFSKELQKSKFHGLNTCNFFTDQHISTKIGNSLSNYMLLVLANCRCNRLASSWNMWHFPGCHVLFRGAQKGLFQGRCGKRRWPWKLKIFLWSSDSTQWQLLHTPPKQNKKLFFWNHWNRCTLGPTVRARVLMCY